MTRLLVLATLAALTALAACADPAGMPSGDTLTDATTTSATSTTPDSPPGTTPDTPVPTDPARRPTPVIGDPVVEADQPVDLAVRPGDDALYLVERIGRVVAVEGGTVTTVLDITDATVAEGERGLLGLVFSLDGDRAVVDHTDLDGDIVIAEYTVLADGNFDPASRRELLTIDQPYANHNGGGLAVDRDGHLYIGMGDGGSADDPDRVALDPGDLLGKVLRIDPTPNGDLPYSIPDTNPYLDVPGARPEVWVTGLRNPWRLDIDPDTGDLWIADVGQNSIEEIDVLLAGPDGRDPGRGVSLGWSAFEGDRRFNVDQPDDGHAPPLFSYVHQDGRCSISGGAVYRGGDIEGLDGWYLFGDWCSGEVWALEVLRSADGVEAGELLDVGTVPGVVDISAGPDGELWAVSLDGGVHPIIDGSDR